MRRRIADRFRAIAYNDDVAMVVLIVRAFGLA